MRFEEEVASLSNDYADAKHALWNEVVSTLSTLHLHELASRVTLMRERGVALARLKKLCDPMYWVDAGKCEHALQDYYHLARGLRRGPHSLRRPSETPMPLADFLGDELDSIYARSAARALHALWNLHMDVSVLMRKSRENPSSFEYSFYLLKSGEPEHVQYSKSTFIDFDFVPTGKEVMLSPVQVGGLEISLDYPGRKIHVDYFAKDKRRVLPAGRVTAMRYFMCTSLAALCADLPIKDDIMDYQVELSAADTGSGKLRDYYHGFGFVQDPQNQYGMKASMRDVIDRCSKF
jgi:hypothetical protein